MKRLLIAALMTVSFGAMAKQIVLPPVIQVNADGVQVFRLTECGGVNCYDGNRQWSYSDISTYFPKIPQALEEKYHCDDNDGICLTDNGYVVGTNRAPIQ